MKEKPISMCYTLPLYVTEVKTATGYFFLSIWVAHRILTQLQMSLVTELLAFLWQLHGNLTIFLAL